MTEHPRSFSSDDHGKSEPNAERVEAAWKHYLAARERAETKSRHHGWHRRRTCLARFLRSLHWQEGVMNARDPYGIEAAFSGCTIPIPFHVEKLERLGVPPDALAGPTLVRVSHVHFNGDIFDFADDHPIVEGEPVFVFLVTDLWGEPIDLIAWNPATGRTATWLRRAFALGEAKIHAPRLSEHGELRVHRTVLGWLRARQEGICIIRPEVAAIRLECAGSLLAEDEAHGEELDQILTRPRPRILVTSSRCYKKAS
ncbi:hypothetical protein DC522_14435 [Microvirga sp. KLBC 81]|uniref:hypothetical protein n=1 Tax=Microvirga sp. KLBC 81 TaxID=1862707 RepID=UPI000D50D9A7|nr:hypothetical protein [Microvirga sp. KLBC 81]PVE23645.1 hypothetical protein DC522_14435 [Microvirga sp. KLBC 81]